MASLLLLLLILREGHHRPLTTTILAPVPSTTLHLARRFLPALVKCTARILLPTRWPKRAPHPLLTTPHSPTRPHPSPAEEASSVPEWPVRTLSHLPDQSHFLQSLAPSSTLGVTFPRPPQSRSRLQPTDVAQARGRRKARTSYLWTWGSLPRSREGRSRWRLPTCYRGRYRRPSRLPVTSSGCLNPAYFLLQSHPPSPQW